MIKDQGLFTPRRIRQQSKITSLTRIRPEASPSKMRRNVLTRQLFIVIWTTFVPYLQISASECFLKWAWLLRLSKERIRT